MKPCNLEAQPWFLLSSCLLKEAQAIGAAVAMLKVVGVDSLDNFSWCHGGQWLHLNGVSLVVQWHTLSQIKLLWLASSDSLCYGNMLCNSYPMVSEAVVCRMRAPRGFVCRAWQTT